MSGLHKFALFSVVSYEAPVKEVVWKPVSVSKLGKKKYNYFG